ncbi:MAG: dihydropteroate synthase [Alphaproteobacteria bacterium]|nr:dihydropteroate synthase [Alphaproteobacteria bacterium]
MTKAFAGLPLVRPLIMGIVNATPDSFSDGGEAFCEDDAVAKGLRMIDEGADIIDVGGESTRPGAEPVGIEDELRRTIPVVRRLSEAGVLVSIDTRHAVVMEAALAAGAEIVNDVSALTHDPRSIDVVANSEASVVLMHMQGAPATMQNAPEYDDVTKEVVDYLCNRVRACEAAGIRRNRIAIDPGIGFGKTMSHNLDILKRLKEFSAVGVPVLLGVSRKSFIGAVVGERDPRKRVAGSIAAALAGVTRGANILRVHDVAETHQALAVWDVINANV